MAPRGPRLTPPAPAPASAEVAQLLDRLLTLTAAQLRHEWQRLYRTNPPRRLSRDLLRRALAHKIQEQAYGGLSLAARRRLQTLARAMAQDGEVALKPSPGQKPGARLVREWRGEAHCVLVLDDGFLYRDQRYRSLTAIARVITGAHWSGPRFFGLGTQARTNSEAERG